MTNEKNNPIRAYAALAFGIILIGTSAILIRWSDAPGPVTGAYRMGLATVALSIPFYRRVRASGGLPKAGVRIAIIAGLVFGVDMAVWSTGVVLNGATNPTLLANTAPLWVGLGALLFFKEKLNARFWGGLLLALLGAVLILGLDLNQGTDLGMGSLLGLLAGMFYGVYLLITQRARDTLDALSFSWIANVFTCLVLVGFTIALRQPLTGYSARTNLAFLLMALGPQVIGWMAINYALGHLPASIVSPTLLGQPVVTAFLAGPLLGEALTQMQIIGGIAVLTGVFIVHRSRAQISQNPPLAGYTD